MRRLPRRPHALFASFMFAAFLIAGCKHEAPPSPPSPTGASVAPSGTPAALTNGGDLAVGKPAPEFSTTAHDGMALKLAALKGKHVVLYFYPKDETPGCTKEACAFRDAWKDLEATGVVLV